MQNWIINSEMVFFLVQISPQRELGGVFAKKVKKKGEKVTCRGDSGSRKMKKIFGVSLYKFEKVQFFHQYVRLITCQDSISTVNPPPNVLRFSHSFKKADAKR